MGYIAITFFIILLALAIAFGWACLLTWAICFVVGLFGISITFSWKLVIAIWLISSIFTTRVSVKNR